MSLTKDMIMQVESEVESFDNGSLITYYNTYKSLNKEYPNFYYSFRVKRAFEEILNRGLEEYV